MLIKIKHKSFYIENKNHYAGYADVKTTAGKAVYIKGAPRSFRYPGASVNTHERVIKNEFSRKAADLIEKLLKLDDIHEWGKYLSGNFIIVVNDSLNCKCYIITDLGNSYHLFVGKNKDEEELVFSTDIDRLANETGRSLAIDYVSIVDYLTQKSITYPYTFYQDVTEVAYASCIECNYNNDNISFREYLYWQPKTCSGKLSLDIQTLSLMLKEGVLSAAQDILSDKKNIALFLSGGIDSRVLAGIMSELGKRGTAITVSDSINNEVKIAEKIALANGLKHKVLLRDLEYYPRLIEDSLNLEGPHFSFTRSLFLGFRDEINRYEFDAILGGYMSDSLFKLHEANVAPKTFLRRHLGTLERLDNTDVKFLCGGSEYLKQFYFLFKPELLKEVRKRRQLLFDMWEDLRTDGSAWEWSYIWPFMRNKHNSNLTTHIFHYQSFELYTEYPCIEVARIASQRIKLNGRLFNKAMYPFMKNSLHIPVAVTMLPMLQPAYLNELVIAFKHMLPRRWTFRDYLNIPLTNPIATPRSFPDLFKLWEYSMALKGLRSKYSRETIESKIMSRTNIQTLEPSCYKGLSKVTSYHIMYTLLYLDLWRKKIELTVKKDKVYETR